ncbi:MAG: hypothetical protein Q9227_002145 [Pyrenula ochraceoflavens]
MMLKKAFSNLSVREDQEHLLDDYNRTLLSGKDDDSEKTSHIKSTDRTVFHENYDCGTLLLGTVINILVLLLTAMLFVIWKSEQRMADANVIERTSVFSPIFRDIDMTLKPIQLNGSLFPPSDAGLERLGPGPSTDDFHADYEKQRFFVLTADDVLSLGKDPSTVARFPDSFWHFGPDAYIGTLDVFHQLRCFNMLRRKAFQDHPSAQPQQSSGKNQQHEDTAEEGEGSEEPYFWLQLQHCTSLLLQNLLCHADTEVLTLQWRDTQPEPRLMPDYSVNKKCRDFAQVVEWRDRRAVDGELFEKMKKMGVKEGGPVVPMEEGY